MDVNWKTGFEIELLAPPGLSRLDLAKEIASQWDGSVSRCFYPQSEPSLAANTPVFENLVLGFDAYDADNNHLGKFVDDVTIQADLDRDRPSLENWYRILSDDIRLLRLAMEHCSPDADRVEVLEPLAKLFGTHLDKADPEIVKLSDKMNMPIALAATLPGERERPCEIITPPMSKDHYDNLQNYLLPAKEMGFTIPREAAVHIHFSAEPLCNTRTFSKLIQVLRQHHKSLKKHVNTNPNCIRLGEFPGWLYKMVNQPGFQNLVWTQVQRQLSEYELTKYCDFNIMNFIYDVPGKHTFELRILPGSDSAEEIIDHARLFTNILNWCCDADAITPVPRRFSDFLREISV